MVSVVEEETSDLEVSSTVLTEFVISREQEGQDGVLEGVGAVEVEEVEEEA